MACPVCAKASTPAGPDLWCAPCLSGLFGYLHLGLTALPEPTQVRLQFFAYRRERGDFRGDDGSVVIPLSAVSRPAEGAD